MIINNTLNTTEIHAHYFVVNFSRQTHGKYNILKLNKQFHTYSAKKHLMPQTSSIQTFEVNKIQHPNIGCHQDPAPKFDNTKITHQTFDVAKIGHQNI